MRERGGNKRQVERGWSQVRNVWSCTSPASEMKRAREWSRIYLAKHSINACIHREREKEIKILTESEWKYREWGYPLHYLLTGSQFAHLPTRFECFNATTKNFTK